MSQDYRSTPSHTLNSKPSPTFAAPTTRAGRIKLWLADALRILAAIFLLGSAFAAMSSLAEAKDYLTYCKDSQTPADIRYTIDALQEFVGSTDCDRSFELLNRRSIITLKNKQLRTVVPLGSLSYAQQLQLIEGDHKHLPCAPSSAKPPKGLETLKGMTGLMTVRIENYNLTSADFVKDMPWLMKVDLSCNALTDASPVAKVTSLQQLVLPYNQLTTLPDLSGLRELEWIKASHNKIAEPGSFTGIARLQRLNLRHNKLTAFPATNFMFYLDVSHNAIAGGNHPGANHLNVSHNKLTAFDFVQDPSKVSELSASHNAIASMASLNRFKSLYSLSIAHNPISDFNAADLPAAQLDGLDISGIAFTEMPNLSAFSRLRKVAMVGPGAGAGLTRLDQAKLPPNLESLNISDNALSELTLTSKAITSLNASGNTLRRVRFGCPGTELETLINLDNNPLEGAPVIANCPLLSGFSARKTGLKDVRFLAKVTDLWRVDLRDNPIADLSPLKDLERIAVIRLEGTLLDKPGAKTAANCPKDAQSKVLADWCSAEAKR